MKTTLQPIWSDSEEKCVSKPVVAPNFSLVSFGWQP